jgi:hypothetical protein
MPRMVAGVFLCGAQWESDKRTRTAELEDEKNVACEKNSRTAERQRRVVPMGV